MGMTLDPSGAESSAAEVGNLPDGYFHSGASQIALRISSAHLYALGKILVRAGATAQSARSAIPRIAWEIGDYVYNGQFHERVSDADAKVQSTNVANSVSAVVSDLDNLEARSEAILEFGLTNEEIRTWRALKKNVRALKDPLALAAEQFTPSTAPRPNENFARLVAQTASIWRASTSQWPSRTTDPLTGFLLSPLYDAMNDMVRSLTEDPLLHAPFEGFPGRRYRATLEKFLKKHI